MNGHEEQNEHILANLAEWHEAITDGTISFSDFEDIFEDRDPFEFL